MREDIDHDNGQDIRAGEGHIFRKVINDDQSLGIHDSHITFSLRGETDGPSPPSISRPPLQHKTAILRTGGVKHNSPRGDMQGIALGIGSAKQMGSNRQGIALGIGSSKQTASNRLRGDVDALDRQLSSNVNQSHFSSTIGNSRSANSNQLEARRDSKRILMVADSPESSPRTGHNSPNGHMRVNTEVGHRVQQRMTKTGLGIFGATKGNDSTLGQTMRPAAKGNDSTLGHGRVDKRLANVGSQVVSTRETRMPLPGTIEAVQREREQLRAAITEFHHHYPIDDDIMLVRLPEDALPRPPRTPSLDVARPFGCPVVRKGFTSKFDSDSLESILVAELSESRSRSRLDAESRSRSRLDYGRSLSRLDSYSSQPEDSLKSSQGYRAPRWRLHLVTVRDGR